jgi:outer membrane receptor protein involved in Fe transport
MRKLYRSISIVAFFAFVLGQHSTYAQSTELIIKGLVEDDANASLPFASVRAFQSKDSLFVNGNVTNADGTFSLSLPQGNYYVEIGFLGMKSQFRTINKTSGEVNLGTIKLGVSSISTGEVSVIADKSLAELKLDKRVYNVSADLNNQGANATEVLENIPSITVDTDGNVSLRGNSGVRILIDGKYSGFSSTPDALRSLQSDMIDRIEVITNASARYDAQGEAGIINIILKKNNRSGWNGSVNARVGYYPEFGGGFNLNYKKNKFNFNLGYTFNRNEGPGRSNTYQRLTSQDTSFAYRQYYEQLRRKVGHNVNAGIDYDFNERNSISLGVGVRTAYGKHLIERIYENMDAQDVLLFTNTRIEWNNELEDLLEGTITYQKKFRKDGASWTTEAKWFKDDDLERSDYWEYTTLPLADEIERSHALVKEKNVLAQSDFIWPIGKEGKVETGVRSQQREMNNDFGFAERFENVWNAPARFNDQFEYLERVHAGYLMGSNTYKKWSYQVGVRGEYSDITTEQLSLSNRNNKQYFNLFPSAAVSYKSNDMRTLQVSYSRRINRPGQWSLMPFMKFGDNREMRIGNPDINPELTDAYEAGVMQYFAKGSLLSTVYYRRTNHNMETISIAGDDGIIYRKPVNFGHRDAYGFEFNLNYAPITALRITTGLNLYQQTVQGTYDDIHYDVKNFSWTNRTSINYTLKSKTRMQVSGNYEAPRVNPQGKTLSIFFMDAAVTQDIGKNATLGLNVRDVFNSRRWRNVVDTPTIYSETNTQWRPRNIRLVFTYRFNQKAQPQEKQQDLFEGD